MELSDRDRQTISIAVSIPGDDVPVIGWCSRSLWKPKRTFQGLLYRVGEHVIFADPDKGDTVAVLERLFCVRLERIERLFCVRIDGVPALFCKGSVLNVTEKQTQALRKSTKQTLQSCLKLHLSAER